MQAVSRSGTARPATLRTSSSVWNQAARRPLPRPQASSKQPGQPEEEAQAPGGRLTSARALPGEAEAGPEEVTLLPLPVVDERGLRKSGSSSARLAAAQEAQEQRRQGGGGSGALEPGAAAADLWSWRRYYNMGAAQPELVAIALVYLVQGLLGLSRLAVFTFLKDDLALAPATVALVTSAGYAPWMIKPLYGFMSDAVPIFGYRRCSYLAICGVLGAASWAGMATAAAAPATVVALLLLGSASTACADVVADSVVVELVRRPGAKIGTAGSLQSLCWASASAGGIASAYFSGSLVGDYGPRFVFGLTALFPLLVTGAALAIPEERVKRGGAGGGKRNGGGGGGGSAIAASFKQQATLLWATAKQRTILIPAVFVFLWQATPTADTALLFFETNQLGFTPETLGGIRLVGALASLAGVALYNFKLKHAPLRGILWWTAILGCGLGMTQLMLVTGFNRQLGLSDQLFALADTALLTVLGQVAFMPLLVLAARVCPEGVEATLFATLMSLLNSGTFVGSALGSALTAALGVTSDNFDNLAPLVVLCTLSALLPLPMLRYLPDTVDKEGGDEGGAAGKGEEGEDESAESRKLS